MTDTKGGFLSAEDDPWNKALHAAKEGEKPAHMTLKEWERHQLLKGLRNRKEGPFEPGLGFRERDKSKKCRECGSLEIDWQWEEVFKCAVCSRCKEKFPDRYSLLTKTEAKDDYLLTDRKCTASIDGKDHTNAMESGTQRRGTPSSPQQAESTQEPLARHDALLALPSRRIRHQ